MLFATSLQLVERILHLRNCESTLKDREFLRPFQHRLDGQKNRQLGLSSSSSSTSIDKLQKAAQLDLQEGISPFDIMRDINTGALASSTFLPSKALPSDDVSERVATHSEAAIECDFHGRLHDDYSLGLQLLDYFNISNDPRKLVVGTNLRDVVR